MAALPPFKQKPVDVWSIREKLALASSVERTRDQNWVSVSRQIKPFAEPNRPADWFSQKNCALQYGALLEDVEHPKRKRGEEIATPGSIILKNLVHERLQELEKLILEGQAKNSKLEKEIELLNTDELDSQVLEQMIAEHNGETEEEIRQDEEYVQWLKEREIEAERQRQLRLQMMTQKSKKHPRSMSEASDSIHSDDSNILNAPESPLPPPPPSTSLLTSLLRSPTQSPNQSPRTTHGLHLGGGPQMIALQRSSTDSQHSGTSTPLASASQSPTLSKLLELPCVASTSGACSSRSEPEPIKQEEGEEEDSTSVEAATQEALSAIEDVNNKLQQPQSMLSIDPRMEQAVRDAPDVDVGDENIISVIEELQEDMQRKEEAEQHRKQMIALQQRVDLPGPSSAPDTPVIISLPSTSTAISTQVTVQQPPKTEEHQQASYVVQQQVRQQQQSNQQPQLELQQQQPQLQLKQEQPQSQQEPPQSKVAVVKQEDAKATLYYSSPSKMAPPLRAPSRESSPAPIRAATASALRNQMQQHQQQQQQQQLQLQVQQQQKQLQQARQQAALSTGRQVQQQQGSQSQPAVKQQVQPQTPPQPQVQQPTPASPKATSPQHQQQQAAQQRRVTVSPVRPVSIHKQSPAVTVKTVVAIKEVPTLPKDARSRSPFASSSPQQQRKSGTVSSSKVVVERKSSTSKAPDTVVVVTKPKDSQVKALPTTPKTNRKETPERAVVKSEVPEIKQEIVEPVEKQKPETPVEDVVGSRSESKSKNDNAESSVEVDDVPLAVQEEPKPESVTVKSEPRREESEMIEEEVSEEEMSVDTDSQQRKKIGDTGQNVPTIDDELEGLAREDERDNEERERDLKIWKKSALLVWRTAANHSNASVFMNPVAEEMAPGYDEIVYRPMDLLTIRKNIENGVIRTTIELLREMMLMFQNAIMYNSADHDVYHMAIQMQEDVVKQIEELMANEAAEKSGVTVTEAAKRPARHRQSDVDSKKPRRSTMGLK